MVLAPLCCGHQVNRISGLQVTLGQFNGNTAAWACTVARVRNGSGILGFHYYFLLVFYSFNPCLDNRDLSSSNLLVPLLGEHTSKEHKVSVSKYSFHIVFLPATTRHPQ